MNVLLLCHMLKQSVSASVNLITKKENATVRNAVHEIGKQKEY